MKIGFVGLGKLGKTCAACMSLKGHDVVGYDINAKNMQKNTMDYLEMGPNKEDSFLPFLKKSNLKFDSLENTINHGDIIFVAVQTPHEKLYEGITRIPEKRVDFNYSYLIDCMKNISRISDSLEKEKIVVIISTVLPGTIKNEILPIINKKIKLAYNPYFIAMGTCANDFYNPEFVLFGTSNTDILNTIESFYKTIHNKPVFKTSIENAEAIKVLYNTIISTKISIANTIMELSHKIPNCNCDEIVKALSLANERLISAKYLSGGMGDGGGCHPRDNIALSWLSKKINMSFDWFEATMTQREKQTEWLCDLILDKKNDNKDLPVVILGKAFKPETNITVGSPSVLLKNILEEKNIHAEFIDPIVDSKKMEEYILKKSIFFIGTKHSCFSEFKNYPEGSIIIDPFRYIYGKDGVQIINIGINRNE